MTTADTDVVPAGTQLCRVADPTFGLSFKWAAPEQGRGGRFDCTDGSYGYSYLAAEPGVALAEVFTRDLAPSTSIRTIPARHLAAAVLQTVQTLVDMDVQLLHGSHLTKLGHTVTSLTKSDPHTYPQTRDVAARLISTRPGANGLRYRPRHDEDGFAFMLYTLDRDQPLTHFVERVHDDQPLGSEEGLERATLLLARYNVSVER